MLNSIVIDWMVTSEGESAGPVSLQPCPPGGRDMKLRECELAFCGGKSELIVINNVVFENGFSSF